MLEKIQEILREYKANEELTITDDTTFSEIELDSLDTVELIMNLEEEFGVTIEMNEGIRSVGDLITAIEQAK